MSLKRIFLFNLIYSIIVISFYYFQFNIKFRAIPVHVLIITYCLLFVYFCNIICVKYLSKRISTVIITLLLACYHLFIVLIYLGFYIAFENWGNPLTFNVLAAYINELPYLIESLPFKLSKVLIYSVFATIVLITSLPFIIKSKSLYKAYKTISLRYFTKIQTRLIIFFYVIFPMLFFSIDWMQKRVSEDDPIVAFFLYEFELQYGSKVDGQENYKAKLRYQNNLEFNKKNVILIICDGLRYDHLGYNGYTRNVSPFLDSLSRLENATNLKHFYATSSRSFIGISNILSSSYSIPYQNFFIHDLLKKQGYSINFILGGDHKNFFGLKRHYGNNIDYYFDGLDKHKDNKLQSLNADLSISKRVESLEEFSGKPCFFYFHFMSTHQLGTLDSTFVVNKPNKFSFFDKNPDRSILVNDYDNRMLQLNHYIKKTFNVLEKKGYLENTIIVITSDHGQSLGERGMLFHGRSVFLPESKIPLMIIDFSKEKTTKKLVSKFNNQLDVAPTISDLLKIPKPKTWEGNSVFKPRINDYIFLQEKDYFSTIWAQKDTIYQYIYDKRKRTEELFDISNLETQDSNIISTINSKKLLKVKDTLSKFYKIKIN